MKNAYIEEKMLEIQELLKEWHEDSTIDTYFEIYVGEENRVFPNLVGRDMRLFSKGYLENAVTMRSISRENKEVVGHSTIYVVPKEVYRKEFLWHLNQQSNCLEKVYLEKWEDQIGERMLITGYSNTTKGDVKFQTNYHKWVNTTRYVQILKLLGETIPIYEEPMGVYRCTDEQLELDRLSEQDVGSFDSLGKVDEISKASYRLANMLHLQRIPNMYHNITLGPVYCGFLDGKKEIKYLL